MSESPCFQRSEISLAIVGSGGAGVITTGELLFTAAATCGLHGVMTKSYGPQIRGGESACFVRLGDRQFEKQSDEIDLMVVMDWGNVDRFKEELYLSPEAWILYENAEGDVRPEFLQAKNNIPVGWKELASKIVGGKGRANICALGVLCYLLGIKEMAGLRSIEERFGAMEKAGLDENTRSFHAGQDWARQEWKMRPFQLSIEDGVSNRWALTGNQGIVLGSLVAGCDFYAGYPITPATTIMEDLGHYLPLRGGVMIQAEDELAAINMAIGASFGGKKAEYYGGMVFSGGRVTCPVDDPTPLADADVSLDELPVEYYAQNEEGIYLIVGGKIAEKGPGAGCDGPISKIARDTRIKGRAEHTLTLIDFKAGFEDSARGVLTSLDWAIEVVDPTTAAMQMAVNLKEMVEQIRAGQPPATRHLDGALAELAKRIFREARIKGVLVVLNRVTDEQVESYMKQELRKNGLEPIGTMREDPSISAAWLRGTPLRTHDSSREVEQIVNSLEEAERSGSVGIYPSEAA